VLWKLAQSIKTKNLESTAKVTIQKKVRGETQINENASDEMEFDNMNEEEKEI